MNQNDDLKITTFNIRTNTQETEETKEEHLWSTRFNYIKKMVKEGNWDIIGMQEPAESQLKDLTSLEEYNFIGDKRSDDPTGEYNPIFYKKNKFTLLNHWTKWLSETPDIPSQTDSWEASLPRIVTIARFKINQTGQEFHFVNTHFDHVSEEARYQSAQLIIKILDELDSSIPLFLTGDFNGEREERFYELITQKMIDSEKESPHHIGPNVSSTGVVFDYKPKWEDMLKIDYVFVNEHVNIKKTNVHTDTFNSGYPSDHFPITLTCTI